MAVFVDLDDPAEDQRADSNGSHYQGEENKNPGGDQVVASGSGNFSHGDAPVVISPANNTLERVLSIYPIAVEIASHIDIVTLDSLARTCRAARGGLLQNRKALLASTLRCHQDPLPVDSRDTFRYRARASNWFLQSRPSPQLQGFNGKSGQCARDMVSECRKCSKVICRNCAIKQPEPKALKDRYRRLCEPCVQAPLKDHINPIIDPGSPASLSIIQQGICHCETYGVWLCQPCGRSIRNQDQTYLRIWRWRTRYIDVGVTDVERGIPCGRESECLGAVEKEVEMDSAGEKTPSPAAAAASTSSSPSPMRPLSDLDESEPRSGYSVHQYEDASGRMSNKTVVRIKVGRSVPEWHDEKVERRILGREVDGKARRWCGWCWRVIPAEGEPGGV